MSTNFPGSLDDGTTLPNPGASSATNNPSLAGGQTNQNDAIKAIETKIGTGSSTPTAGKVFTGTGTGTSAWAALNLATDVTGVLPAANGGTGLSALGTNVGTFLGNALSSAMLTFLGTPSSANFASAVTDETGSGALVFGTGPSISSPKVSTAILDANGNELIGILAIVNAVNELTVKNNTTGNAPEIQATGDDINIDIKLVPKGTGKVIIADSTNLGGAWQNWTPTLYNITAGNGTTTARYIQIGKTMHVFFRFVMGSTSAMGSAPAFSLPVNANSNWPVDLRLGLVQIEDSGVQTYFGWGQLVSSSTLRMVVGNAANTYVQNSGINSTIPITWGTADHITFTGTCEAA